MGIVWTVGILALLLVAGLIICRNHEAGMRVGENHSLGRDAIEIRRRDFPLRIERLHIAVSQVVAKNEDDVGLRVTAEGRNMRREEEGHAGDRLHDNSGTTGASVP